MKIIEKKVATNSSRDAEKLFQNEGHDVFNAFCERRAPAKKATRRHKGLHLGTS